jgi:hypothetical protein
VAPGVQRDTGCQPPGILRRYGVHRSGSSDIEDNLISVVCIRQRPVGVREAESVIVLYRDPTVFRGGDWIDPCVHSDLAREFQTRTVRDLDILAPSEAKRLVNFSLCEGGSNNRPVIAPGYVVGISIARPPANHVRRLWGALWRGCGLRDHDW